jgi:hypothetical protein
MQIYVLHNFIQTFLLLFFLLLKIFLAHILSNSCLFFSKYQTVIDKIKDEMDNIFSIHLEDQMYSKSFS